MIVRLEAEFVDGGMAVDTSVAGYGGSRAGPRHLTLADQQGAATHLCRHAGRQQARSAAADNDHVDRFHGRSLS